VKLSDGTEKDITIIDSFEAVGAVKAGKMSAEDATGSNVLLLPVRERVAVCIPPTPWRASLKPRAEPSRLRITGVL
jgi:hypothetical protein